MDIILTPHYPMLLLAALTFVCGWLVIPYRMNLYNTEWLPRWIRPELDAVDIPYPFYYPANESRTVLAVSLFFAFLCTTVAGCVEEADNLGAAIPYIYALIPSAYLLHRYFCFHRLNRFTPMHVALQTGMLKTYRTWLILLIWLYVLVLPFAAVSQWLPALTLRLLTLLPAAAALLFVGEEFVSFCIEYMDDDEQNSFKKCLLEAVPHNYYLLFGVVSILLTQAALWADSLVLLLLWIVFLAAFSIAEFYGRFHDPAYYVDWVESWGVDKRVPLLDLGEELWLIRRKELKALRRKNRPCHLIIVRYGMGRYAAEITSDLDNKLRELSLRKESLLYIHTFPTVREARLNEMQASISKERLHALIEKKNPEYENWAGRPLDVLRKI